MDFNNIYAVPAAISSILYLLFIFLVLKIDSKSRLNRIAALFFALLFLWSFTEWMLRWSDSTEAALLWAEGIMCAIILIPPVVVHLSILFPWSKKEAPPHIYALYGLSIMFLAVHINSNFFVSGVFEYEAGYGTELGRYGIFIYLYLAIFALIAILVCMKHYAEADSKIALNQLRLLITGFSVTYFFVLFTGLIPYFYNFESAYPWTTPSFIIMGLVLLYDIKKYHVLLPEAKEEVSSGKPRESRGIEIMPREEALPRFYEEVSSGKKGICLTARNPAEVREELDVKKVPVVDIKDVCGKHGDITAERRDLIPFIITDAVMEKNTVLLLDGMEGIFTKNEFTEFVGEMKELEMKSNMLIVSLSREDYMNHL